MSGPGAPHGCRYCGAPLEHLVLDLGTSPLCESYVSAERFWEAESFYPLRVYVCAQCLLVQVPELVAAEAIYSDYAYFSSYSDSWNEHARLFVDEAVARFGLDGSKRVIEVASNDGYLLRHVLDRGVGALGIEPAANVAAAAEAQGVPTLVEFFGTACARRLRGEGVRADLLVANNVIGHVPNLNDFVAGLAVLLAADGVLTIEIPHFLRTMSRNQFDQIYQEHYCYWTILAMRRVLSSYGLEIREVEELPTHGGSIRVIARHAGAAGEPGPSVEATIAAEVDAGLADPASYAAFDVRAADTKRRLLELLIGLKGDGRRIAGYGAPGKGNTLLNYCGIREDFLDFTVDRNPLKQGRYLPGTRIPVLAPEKLAEARPDVVMLLPWNLREELLEQLAYVREWGGRFLVPIPEPEVVP